MKKIISVIAIAFAISLTNVYAQTEAPEKSQTTSALCTAQDSISKDLLTKIFNANEKVDIWKEYDKNIMPVLVKCLRNDLIGWGNFVKANAENGKANTTNTQQAKLKRLQTYISRP